jgi:hypothetical protein
MSLQFVHEIRLKDVLVGHSIKFGKKTLLRLFVVATFISDEVSQVNEEELAAIKLIENVNVRRDLEKNRKFINSILVSCSLLNNVIFKNLLKC